MINFRVLGPLEVTSDGHVLALGGRNQRVALAILLLNANQVVSTDRLIFEVWGDDAPKNPLDTLGAYISNLRRVLHPGSEEQLIVAREPGYLIQVTAEQLDMLRFVAAADEGRRLLEANRFEEASVRLRDALAQWRGPVVADLADEPFFRPEITALEEHRLITQNFLTHIGLARTRRLVWPYVSFHDSEDTERIIELDAVRSPLTIGRRSSNDLSLAWDQEVSRTHAHLQHAGTGWELVDEGRSRNGSYVNGERVEGRRTLRDGDVIRLGKTVLLYRSPPADNATWPCVTRPPAP